LITQSQRLYITPLVINSLGGRHTHIVDKSNFKKPGASQPLASTPGLKFLRVNEYHISNFLNGLF